MGAATATVKRRAKTAAKKVVVFIVGSGWTCGEVRRLVRLHLYSKNVSRAASNEHINVEILIGGTKPIGESQHFSDFKFSARPASSIGALTSFVEYSRKRVLSARNA